MIEWAVEIAKLAIAEAEIQEALAAYRAAVEKAQNAGNELAANWDGDAQKAFVEEQSQAYRWHMSIYDIVFAFAKTLKDTASKYEQAESQITSFIG